MRVVNAIFKITFCLLVLLTVAGAQTPTTIPITGNLSGLAGQVVPTAYLLITLENCNGGAPRITGFSGIVQMAYQFTADTNGNVNANIWPNDLINCGGTTGATQYSMEIISQGTPIGQTQCYQVVSTQGTWNINTQQPIACQGTPPNPQDAQYQNIQALQNVSGNTGTFNALSTGTLTTTGPVTAPTVGNVQIANFKSGTDFGATVNAAIQATAAAGGATGYGVVLIPPGNYSFTTAITLAGYPNVLLNCQGANLTYTGSAPVIVDSLQTGSSAGIVSTGGIENCNVYPPNTPQANTISFRMGNALYYKFEHNAVFGYNASGDVGVMVENTQYFTEESLIADNSMRTTVGYEFYVNCQSGYPNCSGSFEYTYFGGNYWGPNTTPVLSTGLLLTGGADLQNSVVEFHANLNGPTGGQIVNLATGGDTILRDQIAISSEEDLSPGTAICVANTGSFYANGTLICDNMTNSGNPVYVFGSDGGVIGNEALNAPATNVVQAAIYGTGYNALPDSEFLLGSSYWNTGTITGNFETGSSQAHTGHTDFGYWNTTGSTINCSSGSMFSLPFTLPPGTYTISAGFANSGTTTTSCGTAFMDVLVSGTGVSVNQFGPRNPGSPVSFTITAPTAITWEFQYAGENIAPGGYIAWYAPQIEQGTEVTAYKASLFGGQAPVFGNVTFGSGRFTGAVNAIGGFQYNTAAPLGHYLRGNGTDYVDNTIQAGDLPNAIPNVGSPTANQAACIKSLGPPVVIGYCSTVVGSSGGCTCN